MTNEQNAVETAMESPGPLSGVTVLEVGGIGPLPQYGMMMADLGARVIRIDRLEPGPRTNSHTWLFRGRESLTIDMQNPEGLAILFGLVERADILVEGYRPGVAERLGFGPDVCLKRNPRLVYGRMTGWGGFGPLAQKGGHDLNYIAISGALACMGPPNLPPPVPMNLIGDYGGGAMMLAFGTLAALHSARQTGKGQTVEAAMSDGTMSFMSQWFSMRENGGWTDEREDNLIDGGGPFYRTYETSDGKYVSVGAIERKFYANLLVGLGLDESFRATQMDKSTWPETREKFAQIFKSKTRAEWEERFADLDACFAPVLTMDEALEYPHNVERGLVVKAHGMTQIGPPVRFSETRERIPSPAPDPGAHNDDLLAELGFSEDAIAWMRADGVCG
jgi:alpha-methylacyl-CoA racemase